LAICAALIFSDDAPPRDHTNGLSKNAAFDATTGQFRNADSGAVLSRDAIAQAADNRSSGVQGRLPGAPVAGAFRVQSQLAAAAAGGRTLARGVVLRALSREEGCAMAAGDEMVY